MTSFFAVFGANSRIYANNDINSPFKQNRIPFFAHYNKVGHI